MPNAFVLPLADAQATLDRVGGKGASLARLAAEGLPVPPGFHVTTETYRRFVADNGLQATILAATADARPDDPASLDRAEARIRAAFAAGTLADDLADAIRQAYHALHVGAVAVRSSATAEDLPGLSFAGQQETYLNVQGDEPVLAAVKRCWSSLWTARAIGYRARQGIAPDDVSLAVVVQALVPADAAGILFTANPVTGARDETIINAAWGLGEAIVSGLVTPDRVVVQTASGRILTQDIADKAVMTVRTAEGVQEAPVPSDRRRAPVLTADQAAELAQLGRRIEALYGQPMDIEWAVHDGQVFIVQARPITALPEPAGQAATVSDADWPLPDPKRTYMRASVIELLPDPLSPLFATLGLPAYNAALAELFGELGMEEIAAAYAVTTINDYAYYGLEASPSQALFVFKAVPRIPSLLGTAETRWAEVARPAYARVVEQWERRDLAGVSSLDLFEGARAITSEAFRHYLAIQSGLLPGAYMTEALFTLVYDKFLKRAGDPPALTFVLGYDSAPIRAEKSLYRLARWARQQPGLAEVLNRPDARLLDTSGGLAETTPDGVEAATWAAFRRQFDAHLDEFGHTVYDLDFAKPVPRDDPAPLLETLRFFLTDQAPNPYERQTRAIAARNQATARLLRRLQGPQRRLFTRLLSLAQRFAPLREDGLADVGLGWPALRRMLREIGRRLVEAGALADRDDVFWLTADEVQTLTAALDNGQTVGDQRALVDERRGRWKAHRRLTPPVALPLKGGTKYLGIDFAALMPARADQGQGNVLHGTGGSPGQVTGRARVLHGPDEFHTMQPGDILVAKITTPAWTPLFALAAGVVTDVGGPLSHSSIVAREYGIPAVLGTGVATERLHSGQPITVDGDKGTVTLLTT